MCRCRTCHWGACGKGRAETGSWTGSWTVRHSRGDIAARDARTRTKRRFNVARNVPERRRRRGFGTRRRVLAFKGSLLLISGACVCVCGKKWRVQCSKNVTQNVKYFPSPARAPSSETAFGLAAVAELAGVRVGHFYCSLFGASNQAGRQRRGRPYARSLSCSRYLG